MRQDPANHADRAPPSWPIDARRRFVVLDLHPRAWSPMVDGFVQAQSWRQGLIPVELI